MAYTVKFNGHFVGWAVVKDGRTVAAFIGDHIAKNRAERYANRRNAEMILRWFHSYQSGISNARHLKALVELADRFLDSVPEDEAGELWRSIEAVEDLADRAGSDFDVSRALNWAG